MCDHWLCSISKSKLGDTFDAMTSKFWSLLYLLANVLNAKMAYHANVICSNLKNKINFQFVAAYC